MIEGLGEEVGDALTAVEADGVGVDELVVVTAGIGVLSATGWLPPLHALPTKSTRMTSTTRISMRRRQYTRAGLLPTGLSREDTGNTVERVKLDGALWLRKSPDPLAWSPCSRLKPLVTCDQASSSGLITPSVTSPGGEQVPGPWS